MSEQDNSKNNEQNENTSRRRRTAIKVGSIIAGGVAATGLILGVGGEVAKSEMAGKSVAAANQGPDLSSERLSDPEKYVRSDKRNELLSEKFDDISARVLAYSEDRPDAVYIPKGDNWGELTSKYQTGSTTVTLKLNVSKNSKSKSNPYTVEREHKGMELAIDTQSGPDAFNTSGVRFGQRFKAENDFVTPWTTEQGIGFHNSQGQGGGGSTEVSPETAREGNIVTADMIKVDEAVLQHADDIVFRSGI